MHHAAKARLNATDTDICAQMTAISSAAFIAWRRASRFSNPPCADLLLKPFESDGVVQPDVPFL